jgi:hypothetical protein
MTTPDVPPPAHDFPPPPAGRAADPTDVRTELTTEYAAVDSRDLRGDPLSEYLRTHRELLATHRDVMLALVSGGSGLSLSPGPARVAATAGAWQREAPVVTPALTDRSARPPALATPALADRRLAVSPAVAPSAAPVPVSVRTEVPAEAKEFGGVTGPQTLAPSPAPAVAPGADLQGALLELISERTGYPEELIELDLDLEADLSVDSIKRAEIAGEIVTRLGLPVDGTESDLEDLVRARTVAAMATWLGSRIHGSPAIAAPPSAEYAEPAQHAAPTPGGSSSAAIAGTAPQRLVRETEVAVAADGPTPEIAGARFLVTGGGPVADLLVGLLARAGAAVTDDLDDADGTLVLDGLADGETSPLLPGLFGFVQRALATGPRWLIAAGPESGGPRTDGLAGLMLTIAQEYPGLHVRYVRVPGDAEPDVAARAVFEELAETGSEPIVTHGPQGRHIERLVSRSLGALASRGVGPAADGCAEANAIGLDRDSVVVFVGGARGITPWFARAIAAASRCRLELTGRTGLPEEPEDPDIGAARDASALRAVLARRGMRSPADIERAVRGILAGREVAATMAELTGLGSHVRYHQLDVLDAGSVRSLLGQLRQEHGRIDGLIYAAGVIEDKLLAEKDLDSFARVYRTKVDGARTVLTALDEIGITPGFVVLFGSIAAFGSRGQGDYAAANDALEHTGARWAREGDARRCLTVHWGPWAPVDGHSGMVTPHLAAEYARRGIPLIDPEEGAASLLRELAWGDPDLTSVVQTGQDS